MMADTPADDGSPGPRAAFEIFVPNLDAGPSSAPLPTDFGQVRNEERRCIEYLRRRRAEDGVGGVPFSLAFSGGGTRAAAFQAGVLWRLAQEDKLKDVEYIAAVSGGAYVASAFASHCLAAEPPATGDVRTWYLGVVANMLSRMQYNAGGFVRDAWAKASRPEDSEGSGYVPRICDLPMLVMMVLMTVLMNPVMFLVIILVPFTMGVELFFGAAMRAGFCADEKDMLAVLLRWSSIFVLVQIGCWLAVVDLCIFVLRTRCCKLVRRGGRWNATYRYLGLYALQALVNRVILGIAFLVVFIYLTLFVQVFLYGLASDTAKLKEYFCWKYVHALRMAIEHGQTFEKGALCTNEYMGDFWYNDTAMARYFANSTDFAIPGRLDAELAIGVFTGFVVLLLGGMTCSVVFLPIMGKSFFMKILQVAGPVLLVAMMTMFVQYCVFGPVTGNRMGSIRFTPDRWHQFVGVSLGAATCLLPFYEEIRTSLHKYYTRCLQQNFFSRGRDCCFADIAESPYCPFLILTATSSDYRSLGEKEAISELFFTALHFGGPRTGYAEQPKKRSLAKCTAISGAGCLDAISLSMSDALAMRFWLEVLNLTWGDFVPFGNASADASDLRRRVCNAASPLWFVVYIMLNFSWHFLRHAEDRCPYVTAVYSTATVVLGLTFAASFFSFLPCCELIQCLNMSPLIRQIHQATKFFYVGNEPPGMLYMTDGGIKDCTGIMQLLRRRCARILLVLSAADPNDDLGVFRTMMGEVIKDKIASFYDPKDPRRSIDQLLDEFKRSKDMPFLHMGLYYEATEQEASSTGKLIIVKNRLPRTFQRQPVQALLTVEEVRAGQGSTATSRRDVSDEEGEAWGNLTTDQLGPFGCCDCCHTNGWNCGPKFPHGTFTNYLYLTPQWFNSLARLGFASSERAVQEVTSEGVSERWEQHVDECPPEYTFHSTCND